jgi:hypothetical protein
MLITFLAIFLSTRITVRRKYFHIFYGFHILCYATLITLLFVHGIHSYILIFILILFILIIHSYIQSYIIYSYIHSSYILGTRGWLNEMPFIHMVLGPVVILYIIDRGILLFRRLFPLVMYVLYSL